MTLRISLTPADLVRIRFGMSPLYETVRCLRVLDDPGAHAIHLPWIRWARPRVPTDPDVALLIRLATARSVPVNLLPPPDSRMPALSHELRRVRQANPDRVRESLHAIFGKRQWLTSFYDDPTPMMARMATAIERCHDSLIAPHWQRMRVILEADIEHRARMLSERGAEAVIGDLHEQIRWSSSDVLVWPADPQRKDGDVVMSGQGLVLSPNIFGWPHCSAAMKPTGAASLRYPARGIGTLWETPSQGPVRALNELLGPTRAGILLALGELNDTPTLARKLGVTSGAISQHLRVLRDAGLVRTQRTGRSAVHLRTARADALFGRPQERAPGR